MIFLSRLAFDSTLPPFSWMARAEGLQLGMSWICRIFIADYGHLVKDKIGASPAPQFPIDRACRA